MVIFLLINFIIIIYYFIIECVSLLLDHLPIKLTVVAFNLNDCFDVEQALAVTSFHLVQDHWVQQVDVVISVVLDPPRDVLILHHKLYLDQVFLVP